MRKVRYAAAVIMATILPAHAEDVWHATHTLMPGDIVRQEDVAAAPLQRPYPGALPATQNVVGLEVKLYISPNRPLVGRDIGPRSAVKANTPVTVMWKLGELSLEMDGRALESGAIGDEIRVLNPGTSRTIRGIVVGDSMIEIRSEP